MVALACNPSYLGIEIRKVKASPGKKTPSEPNKLGVVGVVVQACHPSYTGSQK
jgi:ribosomal protein L31